MDDRASPYGRPSRTTAATVLEPLARIAVWSLLVAAPFASGDARTGLLILAALVAGYRFLWRSRLTGAWWDRGLGIACLFAGSAAALEGLGWADIPWWLGIAAVPASLLLDAGVRLRRAAPDGHR